MIVVAIIGLLGAIAVPNLVRARKVSHMNSCINNLRQIDSAKQQQLLELGDTASLLANDLKPYFAPGEQARWPVCPATQTETYDVGTKDEVPTCSNSTLEYPHALP